MKRTVFQHGLVIGKFYPPHLGHEYLIQTAATHCQRVTVAVLGSSVESLTIAERVRWLQATFAMSAHVRIVGELDDAPVDYDDPQIWLDHINIMRSAIAQADNTFGSAPPVDAVFTSEITETNWPGTFPANTFVLTKHASCIPLRERRCAKTWCRNGTCCPPQ
jgi:cytidyltransferase-like protein